MMYYEQCAQVASHAATGRAIWRSIMPLRSGLGCTICRVQYRMALCQTQGTMLPSPTQLKIPMPHGVGLGARGISWLLVPEEACLCVAGISLLLVPGQMVGAADSCRTAPDDTVRTCHHPRELRKTCATRTQTPFVAHSRRVRRGAWVCGAQVSREIGACDFGSSQARALLAYGLCHASSFLRTLPALGTWS